MLIEWTIYAVLVVAAAPDAPGEAPASAATATAGATATPGRVRTSGRNRGPADPAPVPYDPGKAYTLPDGSTFVVTPGSEEERILRDRSQGAAPMASAATSSGPAVAREGRSDSDRSTNHDVSEGAGISGTLALVLSMVVLLAAVATLVGLRILRRHS